jgi:hypothetical protein
MVLFQVLLQKFHRAALSSPMANKDDLFGVDKRTRHLFVERSLLGNTLALVMRFLAMNQVAMESVWVIWPDGGFTFRTAPTKILIQTRGMMIDDDNHAAGLMWLTLSGIKSSIVKKPAEARNLFNFEIVGMWAFEKRPLRTDDKYELVACVLLDLTDLSNELNYFTPT